MRTPPSGQASRKTFQDVSLDEFRSMLGVEGGKYAAFGALNKHVVKPALMEINALAPFNLVRSAGQGGQEGHEPAYHLVEQEPRRDGRRLA